MAGIGALSYYGAKLIISVSFNVFLASTYELTESGHKELRPGRPPRTPLESRAAPLLSPRLPFPQSQSIMGNNRPVYEISEFH